VKWLALKIEKGVLEPHAMAIVEFEEGALRIDAAVIGRT
jgi:hypothetical protein